MKRMISLAAAVLGLMSTGTVCAQDNAKSALENFVSNKADNNINHTQTQVTDANDYYAEYDFSLTKKETKRFEKVKKAFYQDMSNAYEIFKKDANDGSKKNCSVAYGRNLTNRLYLGWASNKDDENVLFLFFNSKKNATYRDVYGLVWRESNDGITGTMYKIYGMNPKKAPKDLGKRSRTVKSSTTTSTTTTTSVDSNNGELSAIVSNGDNIVRVYKDGRVSVTNKDGSKTYDDATLLGTGTSAAGITSEDPIQTFNNMRAAYIYNLREGEEDNATMLTALANYILDFCKTKGKKMSADEKELCNIGLVEMQQKTTDKYVKGIFKLAIKEMK